MSRKIKHGGSWATETINTFQNGAPSSAVRSVLHGGAWQSEESDQDLSQLRVVGRSQFIPAELLTQATGYDTQIVREGIRIGSGDVGELVFSWLNHAINSTQTTGITLQLAAIETWDGSAVAPITFSGQRSVSLPANANDVQSDPLLPSALGLTKFDRGSKYWLRLKYSVPSGGKYPSTRTTGNTGLYSGITRCVYASATPSVPDSAIDSTGDIIPSTGSRISMAGALMPVVLGRFIGGDKPTLLINGSSVEYGTGDTTLTTNVKGYPHITDYPAGGYAIRAMFELDMASITLAKASSSMSWFTSSATRNYLWQKYCKYALCGFGANDIASGSSASTVLSGINTVVNLLRSNGAEKILFNEIGNRTSSTDSWATEANQTYTANWEVGGVADAVRAGTAALVGSTIDDYVEHPSIRGVDNHKWVVDGSAGYATADGIHPSKTGAELMSTDLVSALQSL